jgi:hypothetical protein
MSWEKTTDFRYRGLASPRFAGILEVRFAMAKKEMSA